MSLCICGHYESEHGSRELGARCRVRHGAWSESFLEAEQSWEQCDCPGFEPDPDHQDDDAEGAA